MDKGLPPVGLQRRLDRRFNTGLFERVIDQASDLPVIRACAARRLAMKLNYHRLDDLAECRRRDGQRAVVYETRFIDRGREVRRRRLRSPVPHSQAANADGYGEVIDEALSGKTHGNYIR